MNHLVILTLLVSGSLSETVNNGSVVNYISTTAINSSLELSQIEMSQISGNQVSQDSKYNLNDAANINAIAGLSAKDIFNLKHPTHKLSIGPQFQDHDKPENYQLNENFIYAKPKIDWTQVDAQEDELEGFADHIFLEEEDYVYRYIYGDDTSNFEQTELASAEQIDRDQVRNPQTDEKRPDQYGIGYKGIWHGQSNSSHNANDVSRIVDEKGEIKEEKEKQKQEDEEKVKEEKEEKERKVAIESKKSVMQLPLISSKIMKPTETKFNNVIDTGIKAEPSNTTLIDSIKITRRPDILHPNVLHSKIISNDSGTMGTLNDNSVPSLTIQYGETNTHAFDSRRMTSSTDEVQPKTNGSKFPWFFRMPNQSNRNKCNSKISGIIGFLYIIIWV